MSSTITEYDDAFCPKCGTHIKVEVGVSTEGVLCDECIFYEENQDPYPQETWDSDPGL